MNRFRHYYVQIWTLPCTDLDNTMYRLGHYNVHIWTLQCTDMETYLPFSSCRCPRSLSEHALVSFPFPSSSSSVAYLSWDLRSHWTGSVNDFRPV